MGVAQIYTIMPFELPRDVLLLLLARNTACLLRFAGRPNTRLWSCELFRRIYSISRLSLRLLNLYLTSTPSNEQVRLAEAVSLLTQQNNRLMGQILELSPCSLTPDVKDGLRHLE